ncbi:HAD-IIA family hydrolase [Micromonosporaceae bacterium Da 78-11]
MIVLLDLDGTTYDRGVLVPGADTAVAELRRAGYTVRFCTNTDSLAEQRVLDRIRGFGIPAGPGDVFTPVTAAQRILRAAPDSRAFVIGNDAVRGELSAYTRVVGVTEAATATHVVVGDCRDELTYPLLDAAFRAVRAGAGLLALQRGRYFRGADGDHLDTGAVVAAIEYAAGTTARVLGKPSPEFLRLAAGPGELGDVWVVGDDRDTDVLMARRDGARSVQVRTGKYAGQSGADLADHTVDSVADLPGLLAAESVTASPDRGSAGERAPAGSPATGSVGHGEADENRAGGGGDGAGGRQRRL